MQLSDEDVRALRTEAAKGITDRTLARRFGVSTGYVEAIRLGDKRRRAGGPISIRRTQVCLTPKRIVELRKYVAAGHSYQQAADHFGVSYATAADISRGKRHKALGGPFTLVSPPSPRKETRAPSGRVYEATGPEMTWVYEPEEEEWQAVLRSGEVAYHVWKTPAGRWYYASTDRPSLIFKSPSLERAKFSVHSMQTTAKNRCG